MERDKLVLITGATGHSGRYAMERLAKRRADAAGLRFRALIRPTSDRSVIDGWDLPLEIVEGDIRDDACLKDAMAGVDTVLHIVGIFDSPKVLEFAARAGVQRAILVHTTGVYSRYKSASADYRAIDEAVTAFAGEAGMALTILRPTMIYGDLDDQNVSAFIRMMDRLPVMPAVSGAGFPLQPVHRRDLGYAYADALLAGDVTAGKDYVLSGGAPITLREMLTVIAGYLGKQARFLYVPFPLAYACAWMVYLITFTKLDYREKVQRLVEPRAYPHDAAARDFGYAPMDFYEGVRDEVAAYRRSRRG